MSRRQFTRADFMGGVDPSIIDLLSKEEQDEFVKSMQTLVGGERARDFILRVTPDEPVPRHLEQVVDVIEYARIKPIRVCLDVGPGHAKTTILMKLIAWWLSQEQSPGDLCGYVTYSDGQARTKSRIAKEMLERAGGTLSESANADGHWETNYGGGLVAKGSRGGLTGKRIPGLLIYDDPYKDAQEARSPAVNGMVIERFKGVAFTRLQGGSIIILHTRWSDEDLIGYILKELKWDCISIPTIQEFPDMIDPKTGRDAIGRRLGEAAWPEKYPIEICVEKDGVTPKVCGHDGHLAEIRTTLGGPTGYLWNAMYQGRPRAQGRAIFHEPARFSLKTDFAWKGKRGVIAIDPAATAKTSGDFSVMLVCAIAGFGIHSTMWIVDCIRVQEEIPKVVTIAKRLQKQYRLMIACETVGVMRAVPQSLRAMDSSLRVMDIEVGGKDKFTRAQAIAAAWNNNRVLIPVDASWADTLINEFKKFTGTPVDAHDDQVDAGAHGWNVLYRVAPKVSQKDYAESSV